jgi:hypothetical protein
MWKHFKLVPFLLGLVLSGIVFIWLKPESADKVVKWPHPNNAGKVVYRDRNGLCYTFEAQIADCAKVKEKLKNYAFE